MMTVEQIHHWYYRNLDVKSRTIYFGPWQPSEEMVAENKSWEVNDWSIQNLIKGLYLLESINKKAITIVWVSFGGDWDAGMAVYDYIKHLKSPITMKCYGRVRSMGTIILQACKKRLLAPNCLFLIHYGTAGTDPVETQNLLNFAKHIDKNNRTMENIYLRRIKEKHPKYTKKKLREEMPHDRYFTPHEAVYLGLADRVF